MPDQEVVITMDRATLAAVAESGYWLYAFGAVESSDAAGQPLVWMCTQAYSVHTYVTWGDELEAYTAPGTITWDRRVRPGFSAPAGQGQLLVVAERTGVGDVTDDGSARGISVLNATPAQMVCGISRRGESGFAPVCSLPLYGGALQSVVPLASLLLLFSPVASAVGTPARIATGPGVLLDLARTRRHAVRFDINAGWDWGGEPWGEAVSATTDLKPLLMRPVTFHLP
jgi:hypothetical protein